MALGVGGPTSVDVDSNAVQVERHVAVYHRRSADIGRCRRNRRANVVLELAEGGGGMGMVRMASAAAGVKSANRAAHPAWAIISASGNKALPQQWSPL